MIIFNTTPHTGVFLPKEIYNLPIRNSPMTQSLIIDGETFQLMGNGYNVNNMMQLGYPNHIFQPPLQGFSIDYNCLAFALDAGNVVLDSDNDLLESDLRNFILDVAETYPIAGTEIVNSFLNGRAALVPFDEARNFQENEVLFFFLNGVLTHASRYFNIYSPINSVLNELNWVSKLGEGLLVSHLINDLNGPVYGQQSRMLIYL